MAIEFILVPAAGMQSPDTALSTTFFFDPSLARRRLAVAEVNGFSAVLIDDVSGPLANLDIAANVARWNASLDIALTHWVGITSPTVAASDFAALDRLTGGRLSLRILNAEAEGEGFLPAWQRTDEYLTLLKRLWSNERPIDHEGPFFSLKGALVPDKGPRAHALPIRMSGRTGKAIEIAARHATVFEIPATAPSQAVWLIDRVKAAAARYGRANRIGFAVHLDVDERFFADGAETVSAFVSTGVTQFMVSGIDDIATMERFGAKIIAPAQAAQERAPLDQPGRRPAGLPLVYN